MAKKTNSQEDIFADFPSGGNAEQEDIFADFPSGDTEQPSTDVVGKKKEDTESASGDGSSELLLDDTSSSMLTTEDNTSVDLEPSSSVSESEWLSYTPEQRKQITDKESQDKQLKLDKKVSDVSAKLPKDLDYLSSQEDISSQLEEKLGEDYLAEIDKDALALAIEKGKQAQLEELSKKELAKETEARKLYYLDRISNATEGKELTQEDFKAAEQLAKDKLSKDLVGIQFESLGLSEDEMAEYRSSIFELNDLQKQKRTPENIEKMDELLSKIDKIREISNKNFIDPETGNVEEKSEVAQLAKEYSNKYSNDYTKLKTQLDKETAEVLALEKEINTLSKNESVWSKDESRKPKDGLGFAERLYYEDSKFGSGGIVDNLMEMDLDPVSKIYFVPENKALQKMKSLYDLYKNKRMSVEALSRALLLNEDVFATAKGWEVFEGVPVLESLSEVLTSAGDYFGKKLNPTMLADNDYADLVSQEAAQAGVELKPEQVERVEKELSQKLGTTLAVSGDIMLDIMIAKNALGSLKAVNALRAIKYKMITNLRPSNPKLLRSVLYMGELASEGLAFDLASDDLGFSMGVAEKGAEDILDAAVKKMAGGSFGKLISILDSYATRLAAKTTAKTTGGVISEYTGDIVNELTENGFDIPEAIRTSIGEGDEAVEKLLLTAAMAGIIDLPSSLVSSLKKNSAAGSDTKEMASILQRINKDSDLIKKARKKLTPEEQERLNTLLSELDVEAEQEAVEQGENVEAITPDADVVATEETITPSGEEVVAAEEVVTPEADVTTEETATEETEEPTVETDGRTQEDVAGELQNVETEIEVLESLSKDEPTTAMELVLANWQKLDPESVKNETGIKIGAKSDINPSMTKKGGLSVRGFAESLVGAFSSENGGSLNITETDVFNAISDVLSEGSIKKARDKYSNESKLKELKNRKADLEVELESLRPKEFEELSVEEQQEILAKEAESLFTEEELSQPIKKDKIQDVVDKLDGLQKKLRANPKADFGVSAALDVILTLTKAGLRAGMTLRDAFQKAKKSFSSDEKYKDQYSKLTKEQKAEVDSLNEDILKKDTNNVKVNPNKVRSIKNKETKSAQNTFLKELKDKTFKKDSQGNTISLLSPAQRNTATNLVKNIKDAKSLNEARRKLNNLIKTGKTNPTAEDFTNYVPKEFISLNAKQLNSSLNKAAKKASKLQAKAKGKLLSDTFKKLKEAQAKLTEREFKALAKQVLRTNPNSFDQLTSLNEKIDDLIKTSEQRKALAEVKSLQAKLKKEIKKGKHKGGFGVIKEKAKQLAGINPRDVSSLDMLRDVVGSFLESISTGKGTLESQRDLADVLISEATEKSEARKLERQAFIEEQMRDEYNTLKEEGLLPDDIRNYEDYVDFLNGAKVLKAEESALEKEADLVLNLVDKLSSLEDFKQGDTFKQMTPNQKAIINILSKTKEVLVDSRNMTTEQLLQLNNAINEILTYDSTSGVAKAAAIINGVRKGAALKLYLTGKLQSSIFSSKNVSPNLSAFLAGVTSGPEAAKRLGEIMFGEYDDNHKKGKLKTDKFDVESGKKRRELKLKDSNSTRIGLISDLRQTPEGVDPVEDLQNKIEHIEKQIEKLSNQAQKEFKRQAKDLKKNYDELGLKDVKSKEELLSKLSSNEAEYLTWLEEQFAEELPALQDAYRNQTGKEMETVSNYTPTYVYKITKSVGKNGEEVTKVAINNGTNVDPSGRTIKRQRKLTSNEIKNYDIFRTSLTGYGETQSDINTLLDRATLEQMMKSKPFKEVVAVDMNGEENNEIYSLIKNRVNDLVNKRSTFNPKNIATMHKVAQLAKQYIQGLLVLPLKTRDQLMKQPISIILNSIPIAPRETAMAFGYFTTALKNSKTNNALNKLLESSNVVLRNPLGDSEIPNSKLFSEEVYKSISLYLSEGKPLSNKALNEVKKAMAKGMDSGVGKVLLNNDVLTHFDKSATGGSWLAFYMRERAKQEGKGFKFDLEKEAKNPNKEAAARANTESDWVNNKSDYTTQGDAFYQQGVWKYLFLFKSFSLNQNVNAMINTRNTVQALKNKDWKTLNQTLPRLGGSLMSSTIFNLLKSAVLGMAYDQLLEAFGVDMDDEEVKKSVSDIAAGSIATGFVDMYLGGVPDFVTLAGKRWINDIVVESAKEDFEEEYAGLKNKPKFNPYDYKLFYDNYRGEGTLAAYLEMAGNAYENSIIVTSGADLGEETITGTTSEIETPTDIRVSAAFSMAADVFGLGDLKKIAEMYKNARIKEEKAKK
jgi:hypothetical protein